MPWIRALKLLVVTTLVSPACAEDVVEELPSEGLLEYLASMVAGEEGWIGPGDIQQFIIPDEIVIIPGKEAGEVTDED